MIWAGTGFEDHGQRHLSLHQVSERTFNPAFNTYNGEAFKTSLGNLLKWHTILILKSFLLISIIYLHPFSSKPWPSVLSLQALIKKNVFLISPLEILKGSNKISLEPSHLHVEQQLHSAFLCRRAISALWLLPSSASTLTGLCLSWTGGPRKGCRTAGGVSQDQIGGENHLLQPAELSSFHAAQNMIVSVARAPCQLMSKSSNANTLMSLSAGLLSIFSSPQSILIFWISLTQV